jgi:serine/threonine protein kinase
VVVGTVLRGRYVLQARLGTDGQSTVFKALDRFRATLPEAHQFVALKVLHAGADCPAHACASVRLGFHCAQVLSHRNIVNVYELDRDGDVIFFTMELLDGEPLGNLLERLRLGALQKARAWELIRQLGEGLAHAHERGIVHGGLSPQNIMITSQGELRILNFGAAHGFMANSPADRAESPLSSNARAYASCEQLEGRRPDPRDDLYALACISYELLAGIHPFGSRPATLARDYRVSLVRPKGLSGRQWRALQKGLSWHRGGRSISVRLWMHRLVKADAQAYAPTPLQELTQPAPVRTNMPWRAAALFLAMAITVAAVLTELKSTDASTASNQSNASKAVEAPSAAPPVTANQESGTAQTEVAPGEPVVVTPASESARKPIASRAATVSRATAPAISVEPTLVKSDDHFAEIRLHRNLLQKSGSFTWWTESATAKPNVDYVPEAVAVQTFPAGYLTTRLYVRVLPRSLRSRRSYFYIAIAQSGQQHPSVIRRQVWLPTSSSLQARR